MTVDYHQVIRDSREELKQLVKSRDITDKRIAQVILALKGLSRSLDEGQRNELLQELKAARRQETNLADSISAILSRAPNGLTASEIRDRLEESGFDLDEYSQPLATIMTTLQRIVEAKKAKKLLSANRGVFFRWVLPTRVLAVPAPPPSAIYGGGDPFDPSIADALGTPKKK